MTPMTFSRPMPSAASKTPTLELSKTAHCLCPAELHGYRRGRGHWQLREKVPDALWSTFSAGWLSDRLMVPHPCRCSCALISIKASSAMKR